jgi:hypothetical protein
MSWLRNALGRLRRALPKMDFMKNKHEDCTNFDNGTCRFFHFTNVDPKGQACPHFKAKIKGEAESSARNCQKLENVQESLDILTISDNTNASIKISIQKIRFSRPKQMHRLRNM